jgi:hypothetical protein
MEKKTKLTLTLALAVLVITLSLGTAISIALNESGAQIEGPLQPAGPAQPAIEDLVQAEIEDPQFGASPTEICCLTTTSGILRVLHYQTIYDTTTETPPYPTIMATITCTHASATGERMCVDVMGTIYELYPGSSVTIYGKPEKIVVSPLQAGIGSASGYYRIKVIEPQ